MRRLLPLAVASIMFASGCTWVHMAPGASSVRVVAAGAAPTGCEKRGEVVVSVKDRLGPYERNTLRVRDELETMARNEAPDLQADTVQAVVRYGTPTRAVGRDRRAWATDLRDPQATERLFEALDRNAPPLAGVVHNAMQFHRAPFLQTSAQTLQDVWQSMVLTAFNVSRQAIPRMQAARRGKTGVVRQLLARGPRIDAVFAASDLMAIGAMHALDEAGLKVPRDVAVVGFDDIPYARYIYPKLTTVRYPIEEMGERAAELALRLLDHKPVEGLALKFEAELVRRESVA
mgnify:CR=1 FL=1